MLESINEWILAQGAQYNVNPYVFVAIYVGAIPFFLVSIAWLVKRARAGRSTVLPTMLAGFFFVSAYLYLAIFGQDIPVWVWIFLAALIVYGAWSQVRETRRKIAAAKATEGVPPAA
ncbi:hypothetical protein [Alteriqipengyuania lutimaris]|uniref:Uncharacterized protein n=1 Tax=Alteriqipengyuania lutimaris TaxID=1538146 RepID=A0A395LMA0_9SPHN|nr:hypothetical protein [Alteriqipengyuania lutimaris]MBB3032730.1 hypothetical protein [Alteriqipengyuania lutimaris]RDS78163.1 hypothetical protein DL238_11490 [Alteriqipengyuania lutimaris]